MAPVYAELAQALPTEPVLNVDETGHRTNGAKRWLWGVVAATFVVYRIAASRGADVLQDLLGPSFAGVVGSDRLPSYLSYAVDRRQFCWAHVIRGLKSAQELATTRSGQRFCGEALALTRRLFRLWRRFRGDPAARGAPLSRAQLIRQAEPIAKALHALADQFVIAPDRDVRNLARALVQQGCPSLVFIRLLAKSRVGANCARTGTWQLHVVHEGGLARVIDEQFQRRRMTANTLSRPS